MSLFPVPSSDHENGNGDDIRRPSLTQVRPDPIYMDDVGAAYDLWSEVYDTDGNFLQALDSKEMETLLPEFMELPFALSIDQKTPSNVSTWKVADFGCGTGRLTLKLLEVPQAQIFGLDVSTEMLKKAKEKASTWIRRTEHDSMPQKVTFLPFDALKVEGCPPELNGGVDSVVSSLVIEHLPVDAFFNAIKAILKRGGTLCLTNMHSEMGAISQAGFVDPRTGGKIRPKSYIHTIGDVLKRASEADFRQVGDIRERIVADDMVEGLGVRAKKWIGLKVWFCISFQYVPRH